MEKIRDFNGYKQIKFDGGPWQFIIDGFDGTSQGEAGSCDVVMSDGRKQQTPIDAKSRLIIDGRKYGPNHWYH